MSYLHEHGVHIQCRPYYIKFVHFCEPDSNVVVLLGRCGPNSNVVVLLGRCGPDSNVVVLLGRCGPESNVYLS